MFNTVLRDTTNVNMDNFCNRLIFVNFILLFFLLYFFSNPNKASCWVTLVWSSEDVVALASTQVRASPMADEGTKTLLADRRRLQPSPGSGEKLIPSPVATKMRRPSPKPSKGRSATLSIKNWKKRKK